VRFFYDHLLLFCIRAGCLARGRRFPIQVSS